MTATYFDYITPEMIGLGRLKIPIGFDEDGEMSTLSMATLLFCDLHGRADIERELNELQQICFIIPAAKWERFYMFAGMPRQQWENYISEAIGAKYIDVVTRENGVCCLRFCLEVYKLH